MARKAACLPQGSRISDFVTLGVLTATVPGDLIDGVLADTGGDRAAATVNCRPV